MPPAPRAKAKPAAPTAALKRVLASIKADRAKLQSLQKQQKRLLADLQKTVKEMENRFNRAETLQSAVQSKYDQMLAGVAENVG